MADLYAPRHANPLIAALDCQDEQSIVLLRSAASEQEEPYDDEFVSDTHQHTRLAKASLKGDLNDVELHLSHYPRTNNVPDDKGNLPLHHATLHGYIDVVRVLLNAECNINHQSNHGHTPLHLAVLSPSIEIVRILVRYGADILIQDIGERTPLHCAINIVPANPDMIRLLVDAISDIFAQDFPGPSLLHDAVYSGSAEILEFIFKIGVYPSLKDYKGLTAEELAYARGKFIMAKKLAQYKSEYKSRHQMQEISGKTPDLEGQNVPQDAPPKTTPLQTSATHNILERFANVLEQTVRLRDHPQLTTKNVLNETASMRLELGELKLVLVKLTVTITNTRDHFKFHIKYAKEHIYDMLQTSLERCVVDLEKVSVLLGSLSLSVVRNDTSMRTEIAFIVDSLQTSTASMSVAVNSVSKLDELSKIHQRDFEGLEIPSGLVFADNEEGMQPDQQDRSISQRPPLEPSEQGSS